MGVRAILEIVPLSEHSQNDARLLTCLNACESVEKVLNDLLGSEVVRRAQEKARCDVDREENHATHGDDSASGVSGEGSSENDGLSAFLQHLGPASSAESAAIELEQTGKIAEALERYKDCLRELSLAAAKAPDCTVELPAIKEHHVQVQQRICYLLDLNDGELPSIPVSHHLKQVHVSAQHSRVQRRKLVRACAVAGASAGILLGPIGVIGGAIAGAHAAKQDGTIGDAVRSAGASV